MQQRGDKASTSKNRGGDEAPTPAAPGRDTSCKSALVSNVLIVPTGIPAALEVARAGLAYKLKLYTSGDANHCRAFRIIRACTLPLQPCAPRYKRSPSEQCQRCWCGCPRAQILQNHTHYFNRKVPPFHQVSVRVSVSVNGPVVFIPHRPPFETTTILSISQDKNNT